MLRLDDQRWGELKHAYGPATDIPKLLSKLSSGRGLDHAFWEKLWSSLCHQYSTYSASFAAFPHIVAAARKLSQKQRFKAMNLAAGILACSTESGQITRRVPKPLRPAFRAAIADGKSILATMISENRHSDVDEMKYLAMVAAFSGRDSVYGLIQTVCGDFCCPICGADIIDPYSSLGSL